MLTKWNIFMIYFSFSPSLCFPAVPGDMAHNWRWLSRAELHPVLGTSRSPNWTVLLLLPVPSPPPHSPVWGQSPPFFSSGRGMSTTYTIVFIPCAIKCLLYSDTGLTFLFFSLEYIFLLFLGCHFVLHSSDCPSTSLWQGKYQYFLISSSALWTYSILR